MHVDGRPCTACDCGHVLGSAEKNWKDFSARSQLSAEDLGPKVGLHSELVAEAFACPSCGALLATDVRWNRDEVLHDLELDFTVADLV
ncbi:acetone carboxylase subunit gamma [Diaminobutyricimonas sp. LJ205]|uniref:acetone carboxylase subunit gamma n=1 Tax=Diaminobutyricimonas sp. LJ205 TaxID=2683590 RepID=UPI0012F5283D|nr:acetone carboxylase subunit gamma [Diaminobutyricimonas sp. LJ205]